MSVQDKITNLEKEIKEKNDTLAKLKMEQIKFNALPESHQLAHLIHLKTCNQNHTDGCAWDYENWVDVKATRGRYINKAEIILKDVDFNAAYSVISKL